MSQELKRRLRNIKLGLKTSGVDITSGLVGSLSSEAGHEFDKWLANTFNHNFDAYDKAIDSVYNATHIGGSRYHHIIDGQHDLLGALSAVKDVSADDTFARELTEVSEHLLRDTTSVSGTNVLFSIEPESFEKVSSIVESLGITKSYLADAITINGTELLGGIIAIASSIIIAKKGSQKSLSRLGGAMLSSSFASANPLLMSVAAGSLLSSLHKNNKKKETIIEAGKGAVVSGSVIFSTNLIGGPIWWGCLLGLGTSVLVGKMLDNPQKTYNHIQSLINPASHIIKTALNNFNLNPQYATS